MVRRCKVEPCADCCWRWGEGDCWGRGNEDCDVLLISFHGRMGRSLGMGRRGGRGVGLGVI